MEYDINAVASYVADQITGLRGEIDMRGPDELFDQVRLTSIAHLKNTLYFIKNNCTLDKPTLYEVDKVLEGR